MSLSRSLTALLTLALSLPVAAHETIPANWCTAPGYAPRVNRVVNLTAQNLRDLQASLSLHLHEDEAHDGDKCGIVDEWRLAHVIAYQYCAAGVPKGLQPIPVITGPTSVFDADHHVRFRLLDGIQGACMVCAPN